MTLPLLRFGAGDGVNVDLERLYESRLLIQGVSGSGKSTMVRALLEQTYGKVQHLVVDFDGDFVTLREKYDYVLVGPGGDVPIASKTAKVMVRRLCELGSSAIFDVSDMKFGDRREWVRLAFEELVLLPRSLWTTRLVILDEAHIFAPERGSGDSEATDAVIDVITLGRKRGIVAVCATQRLSKFHKDAAAELNNKLIGFTDDVDLQRAGDQLGMTKDQRAGLKLLDTHTFYAYGPAISKSPVLVRTALPETKPPPRGKDRPAAAPARAKVQKILAQLADLPKEAEEEAKSIEDFRRKNAELKRRIWSAEKGMATKTVEKPVVDQAAIDRAVARAIAAERRNLRLVVHRLQKLAAPLTRLTDDLAKLLQDDTALQHSPDSRGQPSGSVTRSSTTGANRQGDSSERNEAREARPRSVRSRVSVAASNGEVSNVGQKILDTIAGLESLGIEQPDKPTVAALVGYHPNAKSYQNAIGALRTGGHVEYPAGGRIALTDDGRAIANDNLSVSSRAELHGVWYNKLGNVARKILKPLIDAYPDPLSTADVAAAAGYHPNAKSFQNMKGRLRSLGLIDYPGSGRIVATPVLFPEGLS